MGEQLISSTVTVATAIVGLAIVAVLVSKNADTSKVISAGSNGFSQALATAISPITGGSGFSSFNQFGNAGYQA